MNVRLRRWLQEWDWWPLARTIVLLGIATAALRRSGFHPPRIGAFVHELVVGWLLTLGLLTQLQLWLAAGALHLLMALDDWTYAASEWLVRPVAGRAPFAVNFLAAFATQIALVLGSLSFWCSAHLGPRLLSLLEAGLMRVFTGV